jgi:hypothetical protein
VSSGDDLFAFAAAAIDLLAARGVRVEQRNGDVVEIDLRALGAVEVFGTEAGAYFKFGGKLGEVRVVLAPAALFTLGATLGKGLPR